MSEESTVEDAAARPGSVEEARRAVEATRTRISDTLDALEHRLDAKKQELKERANILRPIRARVRDRPWVAVGIGLAAGLVLGLLTAGRHGDEDDLELRDADERRARRAWRRNRRRHLAARRDPDPLGPLARSLSGAVRDGLGERLRRRAAG